MSYAGSSANLFTNKHGKESIFAEDTSCQQESVYTFLQRTDTLIHRQNAMDQWQATGWPSGEDD